MVILCYGSSYVIPCYAFAYIATLMVLLKAVCETSLKLLSK